MAIQFECPACRKRLSAQDDRAGKEGKCKCGTVLIVPGSEKMKFACACCGKPITISSRHAGKQGRCPLCKGAITVPVPGILIEQHTPAARSIPTQVAETESPSVKSHAAQNEIPILVTCLICNSTIKAPQSSAGDVISCPRCGCYLEVPGKKAADSAPKSAEPALTEVCPSCERKLPSHAPVCTHCGIYTKSGRPILTAWDVDGDELEQKAEAVISPLSWLIPFGIYPLYSEAMGKHRPYAIWSIFVGTVLVSIWFLLLQFDESPKLMWAKNLMLWNTNVKLDAEHIEYFYEYTTFGDKAAFEAKRRELSQTTPEKELDVAALKALDANQRCFGEFRWYQLFTHAVLHGGIMHLAGNMVFLIVLGTRVNAAMGNLWTVIIYPILGVAAAVSHMLSLGTEPPTPMLGASGAIMGLAGAYLMLFPVHKIYMVIWMRFGVFHLAFKCFAVRGFLVVLFYIMFDIIAVSLSAESSTAHWAHIGGLIWGIIIALTLMVARMVYSGSDILSLVFGKNAWLLLGTPASRLK